MSSFINHNSFLLAGALLLTAAGYRLFKDVVNIQRVGIFAILGVVFLAAYLFLRPGQADSKDVLEIRAQIGSGKPALLELQSPF